MEDHRAVTHVRVVVHTTGPLGPQSRQSHNHWSIYLLVGNNESVRINMAASPGYITGNLEITPYNYTLTNSAIQHWDYAIINGVVVTHIVRLIYEYRRHLYDMSGGGSGCRYWVYVVLNDIAGKGWLQDKDKVAELWSTLHYQYSLNSNPTHLAMVQGEFVKE
ncbi:hypothetical protein K505DRAFT_287539 [Melanomma pulvis-pyrius CBS 109.77]|uniref:DUF7770 domain-containing protein n=1 Tax=Melanomma pulvis-pyrius CBS 109.77 TaxID=1314802 RepID=A0A6A6WUT4_9PLEO|nr:hypothetical protein K505DRAFT_287539 [Melanomma pulvis-pyrius CBS 109.77]